MPATTSRTAHSAAVLVLGTTNEGKVRELAPLLAPHGITCRSLAEMPGAVAVEETGTTFAENAALKASAQAAALERWVLAEDSGLVVPALGGAPGVYSARFAGPARDDDPRPADARNNAELLAQLADRLGAARAAHYACHTALAAPGGRIVATSAGVCHGRLATNGKGRGGFGYDPLFIVPEYHRTFGELPAAVKAVISHRARAVRALLPAIISHLAAA